MCSSHHSCAERKKESGKRVLLVYGGGSIRKNGIYDEAVLKVCFHYGPIALREPENYEARANLMWASTNAINGIATAWKFAEYGRNVWGLSGDDDLAVGAAAIEKTAEFFYDVMELPKTLTEVGITGEHFKEMAAHSAPALKNAFVPLTADDVENILTACL